MMTLREKIAIEETAFLIGRMVARASIRFCGSYRGDEMQALVKHTFDTFEELDDVELDRVSNYLTSMACKVNDRIAEKKADDMAARKQTETIPADQPL